MFGESMPRIYLAIKGENDVKYKIITHATWQSETSNMTLDLAQLSMHEKCEKL